MLFFRDPQTFMIWWSLMVLLISWILFLNMKMFRLFILWIKRESSHLLWIKTLVKWKVTNLWRGWFGWYNLVGELEKQWKKNNPKIAICWEGPLQLSSTPFLHFPQTTTWIFPHSFPSHINKMTLSALHLFRSLNIFLLQIIHTHTSCHGTIKFLITN